MLPFVIISKDSYRSRRMQSDTAVLFAGFIGFLLAWFFTPRTGRENREMAADAVARVADKTGRITHQVVESTREGAAKVLNAVGTAAESTVHKAADQIHAGADKAKDQRERIEGVLASNTETESPAKSSSKS